MFDDERFNDTDMHHFSWGSAYKVEPSDLVSAIRAGVESGTIEGEVREAIDGCIHVDGVPDGEFLIVHIDVSGWGEPLDNANNAD